MSVITVINCRTGTYQTIHSVNLDEGYQLIAHKVYNSNNGLFIVMGNNRYCSHRQDNTSTIHPFQIGGSRNMDVCIACGKLFRPIDRIIYTKKEIIVVDNSPSYYSEVAGISFMVGQLASLSELILRMVKSKKPKKPEVPIEMKPGSVRVIKSAGSVKIKR